MNSWRDSFRIKLIHGRVWLSATLNRISMRSCLDLTDRVAVVIGATSGIGRAIAVGLAEHGADVVPTGRRKDEVESACREIEEVGVRTLCQTSDVCDRDSLEALRDAVLANFGRIDVLV